MEVDSVGCDGAIIDASGWDGVGLPDSIDIGIDDASDSSTAGALVGDP